MFPTPPLRASSVRSSTNDLTTADLSHTNVTGWFSAKVWKGCCQHLRTLNLVAGLSVLACAMRSGPGMWRRRVLLSTEASSAGGELPKVFFPLEVSEAEPFLPSLQELDASF